MSHASGRERGALLVTKHEVCSCGHCRCNHVSGFGGCEFCTSCERWTWTGTLALRPLAITLAHQNAAARPGGR